MRDTFPPALHDLETLGVHLEISRTKGCGEHPEFEKYLSDLLLYKFVLSPAGNGPDVHRTWEALMMGCISIILSGPFDELYAALPVLVLKSWDELNLEALEKAYIRLRYGEGIFAFEQLFSPYWSNLINHKLSRFHDRSKYTFLRRASQRPRSLPISRTIHG